MKKSVRVLFAILIAVITAFVTIGCSKKETSTWKTDLAAAKKIASKEKKNIFLLFSGDDWDGQSATFKENIANTDEFISTVGKEFVLVNIDFSQTEYSSAEIDETTATKAEKKNSDAIKTKYTLNEEIAQKYFVQAYPSMFIVSPEGYVLTVIAYDPSIVQTQGFIDVLESNRSSIENNESLLNKIKEAKKVDRVLAIDSFYEAVDPNYRGLLDDLVHEIPSLDKNNETGLLGKYEMQIAYLDAVEKARVMDVNGAVEIFEKVCESGHLTNEEKQEALYTAAYVLAASGDTDYQRIIDLLNKSLTFDPEGEHASEIEWTLDAVKQMQANAQTTVDSAEEEEPAEEAK